MEVIRVVLLVLLVFAQASAQTSRKRPAGKPAAANSSDNKEIAHEIQELEETLRRAAISGDSTWWERHLDDNYIGTDTDGKITNRAEAIQLHSSPDLKYEEINLSDMTIRTYNADTVIISGKSEIYGSNKGQNISGHYNFVRVWVREGEDWKLAASSAFMAARPS